MNEAYPDAGAGAQETRVDEGTAMRLMILNGPNLNLLGVREPHIYGPTTLASIQASCEEFARFAGAQLSFHQSKSAMATASAIRSW